MLVIFEKSFSKDAFHCSSERYARSTRTISSSRIRMWRLPSLPADHRRRRRERVGVVTARRKRARCCTSFTNLPRSAEALTCNSSEGPAAQTTHPAQPAVSELCVLFHEIKVCPAPPLTPHRENPVTLQKTFASRACFTGERGLGTLRHTSTLSPQALFVSK